MFMGPITAAETPAARTLAVETRPDYLARVSSRTPPTPASPILRIAVGVPVLLLAALVMLPWMAVIAVSAGAVLGVRAFLGAPRAVFQAADYAGRVALGR